jgi:hypothetical protein
LWVHVCPWFVLAPKTLKLRTNQLVVWFVQVCVNNWCLSSFLVPILELQHAPLPPKCYELGSMPQLLTLPMFSLQTHIWIHQGAWKCVNYSMIYNKRRAMYMTLDYSSCISIANKHQNHFGSLWFFPCLTTTMSILGAWSLFCSHLLFKLPIP